MSASIYTEKLVEPNDKMLTYDLAETKKYLDKIAEFIEIEYGDFKYEWKFYNKKSGWILKMPGCRRQYPERWQCSIFREQHGET